MTRRISLLFLLTALAFGRKFYDDDPLISEPKPLPVEKITSRKLSDYFDFFSHLFATPGEPQLEKGPLTPAGGVNTMGEPMEGAWWARRHYYSRMTVEELKRGASQGLPPSENGPWTVIGAKNEGITPGFVILDANKRRYFVKFDPVSNPEMATGADQIAIKIFHALGYHMPDNYLAYFTEEMLELGADVEIADKLGNKRKMTRRDVNEILLKVPKAPDGKYRSTASLAIPGKGVGPYRYYGRRRDDPNDLVLHEHRRDLRGLHVFCAWTGHDDSRSINTYDTVTEELGSPFIKHYLLDLGSTLGSGSQKENSPRSGGEYLFSWRLAMVNLFTLGLNIPFWAQADYPEIPAVGKFESKVFDPELWVPEYPNPAFLNRLPDDEFWAAKQVMAFTDAEIAALVETAAYTDPRATAHITRCLIQRRDKIGKAYFSKVLPLDRFSVHQGQLAFEDLGERHKLPSGAPFAVEWHRFDNEAGAASALGGPSALAVPSGEGYWMARISSASRPRQTVNVYVRTRNGSAGIAGVERTW